MKNVFIIADDTTGANSSAILLKKLGYDCVSIHAKAKEIRKQSVYAFSTNSRGVDAGSAYASVNEVLEMVDFSDAIYNKRVDSTLRGNLGSELNAFLDKYPNKKAIVVASFPDSGRICKDDTLYVNGVLLEHTDVAKDPKMPVHSSSVSQLFKKQLTYETKHINLDQVRSETFDNVLQEAYNEYDVVIVDAVENADIESIADACVRLKLDIITVDPGPFTYYYAKSLKKHEVFRFHCLIGSVTPLSIQQILYAKSHGAFVYELDVNEILSPVFKKYINEVLYELKQVDNDFIILTTSCLENPSAINLQDYIVGDQTIEDISNVINQRIASLFLEYNRQFKPHCVYTSGGDTTVEFLTQADSYGLRMNTQIIPLTVESQILGGSMEGLHIVSKGGLIGTEETIMDIYNYMKVGK